MDLKNLTQKENKKLTGWKAIASYLDVVKETAINWEKEGLISIYRPGGKAGKTVYAFTDELDDFLKNREETNKSNLEERKVENQKDLKKSRKSLYIALFSIIFLSVSFIIYLVLSRRSNLEPYNFKIVNSNLVILDEKGKEIGRYDTGISNLMSFDEYKKQFQMKGPRADGGVFLPLVIIKDINNDDKNEILFSVNTQNQYGAGKLLYFNHKIKKIWTYNCGRDIKYGSENFSKDFRITGMQVCNVNRDTESEIILFSAHWPRFPTQLVVLNLRGEILGEYWNSGRFNDMIFMDLNNDNKKEIVVCGTNNEYERGCVLVFDGEQVSGGSPQSIDEFKCNSLAPGSEKYYILLPRTDAEATRYAISGCGQINRQEDNNISVRINYTKNYFIFNNEFKAQSFNLSHTFIIMHKEAVRDGKVNSVLDNQYKENLKKGILYWNGKEWTHEPSMSNPW